MRAVFVVLVCLMATVAAADERALAKEHYIKGTKAYDLGLYDDAIREYMEAYKFKDDPALLYNLAQAHRHAGHSAEALRFYKMYLVKEPKSPNRTEVETKIDELQKLIDQQKKSQSLPPDTTMKPADSSPPTTDKPEAASESAATAAVKDAPPQKPNGKTKILAGAVVAGVGVAMLGAGIGLSLVAKQDSDYLSNLSKNNGAYDPARQSRGSTFGAVGPALLGIGGAAVVAGTVVAVLGALGNKEKAATKQTWVAPTLIPGGAGILASGRF